MKKEIISCLNQFNKHINLAIEPNIPFGLDEKIVNVSNEIIEILEKEEMTYAEAYATLIFTYEVLKYKSEKVNL